MTELRNELEAGKRLGDALSAMPLSVSILVTPYFEIVNAANQSGIAMFMISMYGIRCPTPFLAALDNSGQLTNVVMDLAEDWAPKQ
jgi:hypothetical protein